MKHFPVVELVEEGEKEVVHKTWIIHVKNDDYCYWPGVGGGSKARRAALPDITTWTLHEVRVLASFDSYMQAVKYADSEEEEEEEEQEESEVPPLKRIKRYEPEDGAGDRKKSPCDDHPDKPDDRTEASLQQTRSITTPSPTPAATTTSTTEATVQDKEHTRDTDSAPALPDSNQETAAAAAANIKQEFSFHLSSSPIARVSPSTVQELHQAIEAAHTGNFSADFERQVMVRLDKMTTGQQEILRLLRPLTGHSISYEDDPFSQPITSIEQLQQISAESLSQDVRDRMISCLCSVGGKSLGDGCRRMLEKIAVNAVLEKYSLKGRKGKLAFLNLPLCSVLVKALVRVHQVKETEALDAISDCLKYAPAKKGGSRYKPKTPDFTQLQHSLTLQESNDVVTELFVERSFSS